MRFLVVGAGSIGSRHCRNLVALGHDVTAWDADPARLAEAAALPGVAAAPGLAVALAAGPAAVLVCTPPSTHVELARRAVEAGAHVFVEKPIADAPDEVPGLLDLAERRGRLVMVGYSLRFLPSLRRVKALLDAGRIGRVYAARAEFGFHLPAWRPGRDYRDNYAVSRRLGGGILLDAIHELDYLGWLLGDATEVFCAAEHVSDLAGDTEDVAEVTLRFAGGALGQVHLDYVRRAYRRTLEVLAAEGVIEWEYPSQRVTVRGPDPDRAEEIEIEGTGADMYMEEMAHLVRCLEGREAPLVDGGEALRSLRLVEAAKASRGARDLGEAVSVPRVLAVIQGRLGSTRLPGKTLADLAGRPMLAHVIERAAAIPGVDGVVLATTTHPRDDRLAEWARDAALPCVRGSEDDVLDRFHDTLARHPADAVVRVTPDCPFLDPEVSAEVVAAWRRDPEALDYASNVHPPTFPDGLDTEVIARGALVAAWREARRPSDREHVTPFVWRQPERFRLAAIRGDQDLAHLRWTVDTAADLEFARAVYARLAPSGRERFGMREVLALLAREPALGRLNAGPRRNEGYERSLAADFATNENTSGGNTRQ